MVPMKKTAMKLSLSNLKMASGGKVAASKRKSAAGTRVVAKAAERSKKSKQPQNWW